MSKAPQNSPGTLSHAEVPRSVMAWPSTSLGKRSLWLLAGFAILSGLFFLTAALYGGFDEARRLSTQAGGRFFSLLWLGATLVAASVSAVAAGGAALVAIIRQRERSIAMLLPLVTGVVVMLVAMAVLFEGR